MSIKKLFIKLCQNIVFIAVRFFMRHAQTLTILGRGSGPWLVCHCGNIWYESLQFHKFEARPTLGAVRGDYVGGGCDTEGLRDDKQRIRTTK